MSFGSPAANETWAEEEQFNFEIWTDDDKTLALYYGAISRPSAGAPSRITKLMDATGTLVLEYVDSISVGTHPAQVLEDCRALFGP